MGDTSEPFGVGEVVEVSGGRLLNGFTTCGVPVGYSTRPRNEICASCHQR